MKPLPKQTRALAKRQALLHAAQMEFSTKGYDATTSKTIAARAGVAAGTFYQYFENKDDILQTVTSEFYSERYRRITEIDRFAGLHNAASNINSEEAARRVTVGILELVYNDHIENPGFHHVLEQRRRLDAQLDSIMNENEAFLLDQIKRVIQLFGLDNPNEIAFCLFFMAEGLVHRQVFQPSSPVSNQRSIDILADCILAYLIRLAKRQMHPSVRIDQEGAPNAA